MSKKIIELLNNENGLKPAIIKNDKNSIKVEFNPKTEKWMVSNDKKCVESFFLDTTLKTMLYENKNDFIKITIQLNNPRITNLDEKKYSPLVSNNKSEIINQHIEKITKNKKKNTKEKFLELMKLKNEIYNNRIFPKDFNVYRAYMEAIKRNTFIRDNEFIFSMLIKANSRSFDTKIRSIIINLDFMISDRSKMTFLASSIKKMSEQEKEFLLKLLLSQTNGNKIGDNPEIFPLLLEVWPEYYSGFKKEKNFAEHLSTLIKNGKVEVSKILIKAVLNSRLSKEGKAALLTGTPTNKVSVAKNENILNLLKSFEKSGNNEVARILLFFGMEKAKESTTDKTKKSIAEFLQKESGRHLKNANDKSHATTVLIKNALRSMTHGKSFYATRLFGNTNTNAWKASSKYLEMACKIMKINKAEQMRVINSYPNDIADFQTYRFLKNQINVNDGS